MNDKLGAARLIQGADMAEAESLSWAAGQVAVRSVTCPDSDSGNEDAALVLAVSPAAGVLAVADGVGGGPAGRDASRGVLEALRATIGLHHPDDGVPLRAAVLNGIERANADLLANGYGGASTLVLAEIESGQVRVYHVGDSAALLVGQRGRIKWQSIPHSPVGFAVESGMLDEEEAMHHADRHLVSNVIGDQAMRIEIGPVLHLAPRDTLLLASDGLFDNLHIAEIVAAIRSGPLAEGVDALVDRALVRMRQSEEMPSKPDDITVTALRLTQERGGGTPRRRSPRRQLKLL